MGICVNFDFVYYNSNRGYNGNVKETGTFCSFNEAGGYDCDRKFPDNGFECPIFLIDDEAEEKTSEDEVSLDFDRAGGGAIVNREEVVSKDDIFDIEKDSFS